MSLSAGLYVLGLKAACSGVSCLIGRDVLRIEKIQVKYAPIYGETVKFMPALHGP